MREMARSPLARIGPVDDHPPEVLATAAVAACAAVCCPLAEVDALRAAPGPGAAGRPQIAKALRNADEQTVAAVAALLRAAASCGRPADSFRDWGVVGCPRFLGRMIISGLVARYFEDARYSINPHVIPNYSLHSMSGTASVGFTMHGPNFGVGGGPGHVPEGLLAAASLAGDGHTPGVWLLLSEFDPEPRPDRLGTPANAVDVHAVALALTRAGDGRAAGHLRLVRRPTADAAPATVKGLAAFLEADDGRPVWTCPVDGFGAIEFNLLRPAETSGEP